MVGTSMKKVAVAVGALLLAGVMTMAAMPAGQPAQGGDQVKAAAGKASKKSKAPKADKAERLRASGKTVNLNTASVQELTALPKIGAKVAQRIVEYRTAHKGLKSVDELRNVKGCGTKILEGIRPFVSL